MSATFFSNGTNMIATPNHFWFIYECNAFILSDTFMSATPSKSWHIYECNTHKMFFNHFTNGPYMSATPTKCIFSHFTNDPYMSATPTKCFPIISPKVHLWVQRFNELSQTMCVLSIPCFNFDQTSITFTSTDFRLNRIKKSRKPNGQHDRLVI